MRVILLTHGGADLVIERLAAIGGVEVAGVFIEMITTPERSAIDKLKRSVKYDGLSATFRKFFRSAPGNKEDGSADLTRKAAASFGLPTFEVDNFHNPESIDRMRSLGADLGIVFGTNIVRENVFGIPRLGSINLHQGLAPYYRGGPPVFWELFNGEQEVGLTVHFVASKVDTGDIVLQKTKPLRYDPEFGLDFEAFIDDFRSGLRDDSADLLASAVEKIAAGNFERKAQDVTLGKRYRLPTKKEKDEMRRRLKQRLSGGANG